MLLRGVSACNAAAVAERNGGNCRFPGVIRPPSAASCGRPQKARSLWVAAVATDETKSKTQESSYQPSLSDRLRLGSVAEDGFSYKEKFIVRSYEVGINKTATIETMANLLQEVGCNHAQGVGFSTDGFGTTLSMRKYRFIWVIARMHIEMYKYPSWSDVVEIETWCHSGRTFSTRDWIIKDYANGEVIGRATSKWVMMNQDTRRLQKVTDEVHEEHKVYCSTTPRQSFPEENNASQMKITKLKDAQHIKVGLVPRRPDLDMNQHVNNVTYIGWVLESIPQEIIDSHELQTITLDYRRESKQDDVVDSLTSPEPAVGENGSLPTAAKDDKLQFLHLLRFGNGGSEINRGRTEWRKKPAKI